MDMSLGSPATTMARFARRPAGPQRPRGPWKHGPIPVLGLVGGIGAGKSLVAAELAALGAVVLDADAIGHALLRQRPAREQVIARFGREILGPDSEVDRRALGAVVFAHPSALRDLEAILHPRMRQTFERAIARAARKGNAKAVVLDAAVLFEAGWNRLCDGVVFVDAPADLRLARLAASRGWDAEALEARERAQLSLDVKRSRASAVVRNESGPEELRAEVALLWDGLRPPQRARVAIGPRRPPPKRLDPPIPAPPSPGPQAPPGDRAAIPGHPRQDPPTTDGRAPGDRSDEET